MTIKTEHAPKPGANWEVSIWKSGETIVLTEDEHGEVQASLKPPKPNRAQRRAMEREARKANR
jgi:hypothetical protein